MFLGVLEDGDLDMHVDYIKTQKLISIIYTYVILTSENMVSFKFYVTDLLMYLCTLPPVFRENLITEDDTIHT